MKLKVIGEHPGPRNSQCWRAITKIVDDWESKIEGAALEARFLLDDDVLEFALSAPDRIPKTAGVDISWIAYADQAEHLAIRTHQVLRELDGALIAQGERKSIETGGAEVRPLSL